MISSECPTPWHITGPNTLCQIARDVVLLPVRSARAETISSTTLMLTLTLTLVAACMAMHLASRIFAMIALRSHHPETLAAAGCLGLARPEGPGGVDTDWLHLAFLVSTRFLLPTT